jgi:hypothetical protein
MKKRILSMLMALVMVIGVVAIPALATEATPQISSFVLEKPIYELGDLVRATVIVAPGIRSWQIFWIKNGVITTEKATIKTVAPLSGVWDIGTVNSVEYDGIAIFAYTEQYTEATIPNNLTAGNPIIQKAFLTVHHAEQVLETFTDNLTTSSTVNNHEFTLTKPGRVSISFARENLNNSHFGWTVSLHHADGTEMLRIEAWGDRTTTDSIYNYLDTGIYTVRVVRTPGWNHSNVDYTLTVNFTENTGQFEIEHNNNDANATPMKVNSPITGNLYHGGDIDWYTFTLTEPGRVSMNFYRQNLNNSHFGWTVSLHHADGTEMLRIEAWGDRTTTDSIYNYLDTGIYTVRVVRTPGWSHSNIDYTLTVNFEEVCNVCNKIPCECKEEPVACADCGKEVCECKEEPPVVCGACGEAEENCVCVAISIIGDATAIITPNIMITVWGNTFLLNDPNKLTLTVSKVAKPENTEKFFAALKEYLS